MKTQEILSIVALSLLGLCFLCGLAKMAMKKDSDKKNCDKACSMAIFAAVALVGVSQLLTETEKYGPCVPGWPSPGVEYVPPNCHMQDGVAPMCEGTDNNCWTAPTCAPGVQCCCKHEN